MNFFLFVPPVIFIIFALVTLLIITRGRRVTIKVCSCLFAFSAIVGFALYTYSYLSCGSGFGDTLYASLRGIYSVARIFTISDEWSHAEASQNSQWLTGNIWWQLLLWLCHVSGIIVFQSAILTFFGRKLVESFRMCFGFHKELYFIRGNDIHALMMGENIATHDKPKEKCDAKRLVIFLIDEDEDEKGMREKTIHYNGIVKVVDRNRDIAEHMRKAMVSKRKWFRLQRKYCVILTPQCTSAVSEMLRIMNLANERKIDHSDLNLYVFTSSQWDREEIAEISKMPDLNTKGETSKYPYAIHLLSEPDILTRQMILDHSPFECLKKKEAIIDARATKDFTVMILGFGNTGQKALLQLIRSGQFLGSNMRAVIADKNMESIYSKFRKSYPALSLSCEIEDKNILGVDVQSQEFFDCLRDIDESVDYVVVALGNDADNKSVAMDLYRHYVRFCGIMPVIAVSSQEDGAYKDAIFCFGRRSDVYSEAIAINEETDKWASALNSGYNRGQHKREGDDMIGWHEIGWLNQESKRAQVDFLPYMLELANLSEEQKNVMANLGEVLYRIDRNKERCKEAKKQDDEKVKNEIEKEMNEDKALTQTLIDKLGLSEEFKETLAHTEHLRWNAFQVTMGYSPISIEEMHSRFERYKDKNLCRKDDVARLHLCLAHWDELDERHKEYQKINPNYKDFKEMDYDGVFKNIAKYLYLQSKDIL